MGRKAVLHLLTWLSILLTALLLAAALLCLRASTTSPEEGRLWVTAAMLMPVILFANVGALIWWLIRRRWLVAAMPLAALIINMGYISASVQLPDFRSGDMRSDLTVGSLNVYAFNRLSTPGYTVHMMAEMAKEQNLDVLCMQEFLCSGDLTPDSIATFFAPRMPYFEGEIGQAIASRYPILEHNYHKFDDTDNDYMWVDLAVGSDTVRIFSVHLQTSGISMLRRRFRMDYNSEAPVDLVFEEIGRNSVIRAQQVEMIRAAIDSTRYPVIVLGDFNDTPSSYSYYRMKGDLTDGFRAVGNGFGGTFRSMRGVLRIDYIFYDEKYFNAVRYYAAPQDVSDHKTIVAELQFKR